MKHSELAKAFKALASEQRLKVFEMIHKYAKDEKAGIHIPDLESNSSMVSCCAGLDKAFSRACELLNISRSTVSHHFKELQNAGLIECTRNGQSIVCSINEDILKEIKEFLQ